MKAALYKGPRSIVVGERPDPVIEKQSDAVVRVVLGCVCGSDLWYYRGIVEHKLGSIGHEFIGVVEQVGSDVKKVKKGDFVIAPFKYSDGTCPNCLAGFPSECVNGSGFGNGEDDGGQGEFVRVPFADGTLIPVPGSNFSDEILASLLTLSDVMCTGYHAAVSGNVQSGDTVAVIGDGAVGLCAVIAAKLLGAKRIIALSRHPDRQELATEFGATDIVAERGDEGVAAVMKLTDNVGVDVALECVGGNEPIQTAARIVRAGGMIGTVGMPTDTQLPFREMFFKNVGERGGVAPAHKYIPELLDAILSGKINPGHVFTLQTDLDHIADAYVAMDERRAIKSLIKVSPL